MTIAFAKKWAVLRYVDVLSRVEPRMVMSACAHPQRRLFCVTCNTPLAGVGQLAMHNEDHLDVEHVIVEWCDRHHTYELANPVTPPSVVRTLPLFEETR